MDVGSVGHAGAVSDPYLLYIKKPDRSLVLSSDQRCNLLQVLHLIDLVLYLTLGRIHHHHVTLLLADQGTGDG